MRFLSYEEEAPPWVEVCNNPRRCNASRAAAFSASFRLYP